MLLVVGFHVREWIPGGFIGVDVFFVVSGFVIATLLTRQVRTSGSVSVRDFFARRVRRLLPMLAVTLSVTSLLGVALLSPLGASAVTSKTSIAAALLNANTFLSRQADDYFALQPSANALLHTWSLSVEEQFYLVLPFLVVAGLAIRRRSTLVRPGLVTAASVVLAGGSFALFVVFSSGGPEAVSSRLSVSSPEALAFYASPLRAWEFLVGVVVALGASRVQRWSPLLRTVVGAGGLVAIVASAALFSELRAAGPLMLVPVLGAAGVLAAGVGGRSAVSGLLSRPGIVALGDLSYGWYLFHWPLIVFAESNTGSVWVVLVAVAMSLWLAVVAKRIVEDRFRYDDRWRGGRAVALAATCVAVPVLAGLVALVADRAVPVTELQAAGAQHVDSAECNRGLSEFVPLDAEQCTWSVPRSEGTILLIGDSHASMWSEGLIAAGNDLGHDVSVATMSGCPMVGETVRLAEGREDHRCQEFVDRSIEEIRELRPDLVVLATASTGVLGSDGRDAWQRQDGTWTTDLDEVEAIWERGLGSTLEQMTSAGVPVLVVHDVPYHEVTTSSCGRALFLLAPSSCSSERPLEDVEGDRARSLALEDRLDDASELVSTVDPIPWLCPGGRCTTFLDGAWMYRDGDHLSVAAARELTPQLRSTLARAGL